MRKGSNFSGTEEPRVPMKENLEHYTEKDIIVVFELKKENKELAKEIYNKCKKNVHTMKLATLMEIC